MLAPNVKVPAPAFVSEEILLMVPTLLDAPALLIVKPKPPPATPLAALMSPAEEVNAVVPVKLIAPPNV